MFQLYVFAAGVLDCFIDERRGSFKGTPAADASCISNFARRDPLISPSAVRISSSKFPFDL